ncbi:asparaginase domain-containing protein [Rhizobium paknamense]|nr:asparaginase domain-containing protein [Rhizobium paknamense]
MIINTGGTISCVGTPLAPMTARAFADAFRQLVEPALLQAFPDLTLSYATDLTFPQSATGMLDSTNLQPTDWCLMAEHILTHYEDVDGWVVLHGTDTMQASGMALPLLLSRFAPDGTRLAGLSKPVILTGSQAPLFYAPSTDSPQALNFNTDAFQNVCGAIAAAQSGIPDVCVFFDSLLFRGSRVVKTDTGQFRGFDAPNNGPLGRHGIRFTLDARVLPPAPVSRTASLDDRAARAATAAQLVAIRNALPALRVAELSAFPAPYHPEQGTALLADLINGFVAQGVRGLVLRSYGAGNFPSGHPRTPEEGAIYKALSAANEAGVIIMDNTQVQHGAVDYNAYAAGAWLPGIGALNPVDMTPSASLAKLTVLLAAAEANGWRLADVKFLMQLPLVGEMADLSRLDNRGNAMLAPGQSLSTFNGAARLTNHPEKGPLLTDNNGQVVWAMLETTKDTELPGTLRVEADGNLVFMSRNNDLLWASNTAVAGRAPSQLRLTASTEGILLELYDYAALKRTWCFATSEKETKAL